MRNDKAPKKDEQAQTSGFDPELEERVDRLMTEAYGGEDTSSEDTSSQESSEFTDADEEHITIIPSAPEITADSEPLEEPDALTIKTLDDAENPEVGAETAPIEDTGVENDAVEDSPALEAAVDEITRAEADTVLAVEDAKTEIIAAEGARLKGKHRVRAFFARWWGNPIARWATILLLVGSVVALAAIPPSRYFILNTAGVRSAASLTVIDESTGQPLQNVNVSIGAVSSKTNEDGLVKLKELKLGAQTLKITRVAFAPLNEQVTIGWGSNPLGEKEITATGVQYVLNATDALSTKPVVTAKASSGEATALADDKGKIVLTLEDTNGETVEITVQADGYRTETITLPADTTASQSVVMAPAQPLVYVSKQQGTYDLYAVDADGKNKRIILAGTGSERPYMSLLTSPDGQYAAFVSSREKRYDSENYLLDTLSLVNLKTGAVDKIDQAQSIQLIGWKDDTLAYRAAYAAPSAATNDRQRLIAYDVSDASRTALANGNYFVGIYAVGPTIYYGVSTPGSGDGGAFARVSFDGKDKEVLLSRTLWTVTQTKPNELYVNAEDTWYGYDVAKGKLSKQQAPQDAYLSPQYYMKPGKNYGVFIDQRDGQGVLIYTSEDKPGQTLANARGLYGPVTWLNDTTLSYYVDNGSETALYVVSTDGGEPTRVSSVTLVSGASAGYY